MDWILIYYLEEIQSLTQAIYFSYRLRPPEATWRLHTEMTEAKAFRTYSLFKSERLSTNIILTLHKALTRSVIIYTCPASELAADTYPIKLRCLQKKFSAHWKLSKVHTGPQFAHDFRPSVFMRLYNKIVQATSRSHTKS
jgi:hypothetical protein